MLDNTSRETVSEAFSDNTEADNRKNIYTVSRLTTEVKNLLEQNIPEIWIEGEISNFRRPSSGHLYFTLKDSQSQVKAVMYRSSASKVPFKVEDGMKVLALCKVTVYERAGQYQIMVNIMEPRGVGALQLAFEQLKKKLMEEGLFDKSHKKPVPILPKKIGIVTSPTGAAIRDILNVINRRFSNIHLIINPVRVQGMEAPAEIAGAIDEFNKLDLVDVILITRGGGSIEDLWGFNEEIVARSIFKSKIPVISAVGHEIDWTISDYVADLRVPTPSAAAELVVASKDELLNKINNLQQVLTLRVKQYLSKLSNELDLLSKSWVFTQPINKIKQLQQQTDDLDFRLNQTFMRVMDQKKNKLLLLTEKLHAYSPSSIILRGFSITSELASKTVLKSVKNINPGDRLKTYVSDGELISTVDRVHFKDNNLLKNK